MVDASLRATILGSLLKAERDFGISLVYITHDLTTAYQISQNIIVLYGGAVCEAGAVQPVVPQPAHPYTTLLIGSIPSPNARHRWGGFQSASNQATRATAPVTRGCVFAAPLSAGNAARTSPRRSIRPTSIGWWRVTSTKTRSTSRPVS